MFHVRHVRIRPHLLGVLLAALLLATAAQPARAASIYFGAVVDGKAPAAGSFASGGTFDAFEQQARKKMSLVQWGQPWMSNGTLQPFQRTYFDNVRNHGSIPVLNWASWDLGNGPSQPQFQLRDITNGAYDAFVTQWAQDAAAWGHPLMLRFDHEMNGWWYPWGEGDTSNGSVVNGNAAGDYVRAWRHVHDIFTSVGATNVTWLWSPNIMSTSPQYPALSTLYPGDSYVDWTGLSAYNADPTGWLWPASLLTGSGTNYLKNSYQALLNVAPTKPIALAETGSAEAGDGGAKKAAWISDLLDVQLPLNLPQIKAFMWLDWAAPGYATMPIDSSPAATSAFAKSVSSSTYATNSYGSSSASPIPPPGGGASQATLKATADTSASISAPSSTAGGSATTLTSDGSPRTDAFLKFDLSSLAGETLTAATLRFRVAPPFYAASAVSHPIRYVADTLWQEVYLSYSNSVVISNTTVGTVPANTNAGSWYDVPLDPTVVTQDTGQSISLAIPGAGTAADGLLIASRESGDPPQLVVSY